MLRKKMLLDNFETPRKNCLNLCNMYVNSKLSKIKTTLKLKPFLYFKKVHTYFRLNALGLTKRVLILNHCVRLLSHSKQSNQSYRIDLAFVMRVPHFQAKMEGQRTFPLSIHIFAHSIIILGRLLIRPQGFYQLYQALVQQVIEPERKFGNPKWPSRSENLARRMLRFGGQLARLVKIEKKSHFSNTGYAFT